MCTLKVVWRNMDLDVLRPPARRVENQPRLAEPSCINVQPQRALHHTLKQPHGALRQRFSRTTHDVPCHTRT